MKSFPKLIFVLTISVLMSCGEETADHLVTEREKITESIISSEWALIKEGSDVSSLKGAINLDSPKNVILFLLENDSVLKLEFEGSMTEILQSGEVTIKETGVLKNLKVTTNPQSEGLSYSFITLNGEYSKITLGATMAYQYETDCDTTQNEHCVNILPLSTFRLTYEKLLE